MDETAKYRALFLDRDGVINEEVDYLWRREDVRFVPGIFSLCRTARAFGYKLIVVTNQSGIAQGLYSEADFYALMEWMQAEFKREGVGLDAIYFCPYHPKHGVGAYRREHEDRKPKPGMLLRAATDHALDLTESLLVGDRCTDIEAAGAAGLRWAFLLEGTETAACPGFHIPVSSLAEVERHLVLQRGGLAH